MQKEGVTKELVELEKMRGCLGGDLDQEIADLQAQHAHNAQLMKQEDELRERLRAREEESGEVRKYVMDLEQLI